MDVSFNLGTGSPLTLFSLVNRIFDAWPGYQLAVRQNAGGSETVDKDIWLREEVTKYLDGNPTPHPEDIAEWVETVFDQEFNLILEDNSVDAICNDLYKGTTYLKERKEQELLVLWNKIPNKSNIQAQATAQSEESSSDEDGEGNDEDEPMEEDGDQRGPRRQPRMVTDEDGWTTVQKR